MLPIAKSTELLFVNQTYFDRFAAATGPAPMISPIMTSFLRSAASIIPGPAAKTCASWMISITIT